MAQQRLPWPSLCGGVPGQWETQRAFLSGVTDLLLVSPHHLAVSDPREQRGLMGWLDCHGRRLLGAPSHKQRALGVHRPPLLWHRPRLVNSM